jgi:hypothetical protein
MLPRQTNVHVVGHDRGSDAIAPGRLKPAIRTIRIKVGGQEVGGTLKNAKLPPPDGWNDLERNELKGMNSGLILCST